MSARLAVTLGCILAVASARAESAQKVMVIGAGDCREPSLITAVKQFHDDAAKRLQGQLFEPDVVLEAVRPRASKSLPDLQRQVDSARTLLYGGQNERGLELVTQALAELDKASPRVSPWPVTAAAFMVQSQLYKNLGRTKEMTEAYRRILRIEPAFTLDPDAYPPSTLQAFDAVRKELARARKSVLQVQSQPAGAAVFVDGREFGKTPAKVELAPGSYRVSLMTADGVSFPRRVDLKKDAALQVDMAFEGAVSQQPPLCVAALEDDEARKLGAAISAEQVIVVRNASAPGNPPYITAVLYDASGQQVRNGGAGPDMVARLATFIVTGQEQVGVRPVGAEVAKAAEPVVVAAGVEPATQPTPSPSQPSPAENPTSVTAGTSNVRIASYVLLGTGIAGAVAGIIVYGTGAADREKLASLTVGDGRLYPPGTPNYEEAVALMPKVDANRTLAFTLLGAGAGVAVAGVLGIVLFPGTQTHVALFPTSEGGALTLSGKF
jgi:hypothetical protein